MHALGLFFFLDGIANGYFRIYDAHPVGHKYNFLFVFIGVLGVNEVVFIDRIGILV